VAVAVLNQRFDGHPNEFTQWKSRLLEQSSEAFGGTKAKEPQVDVKTLHAK
jgi:hypothetical protein